jgi:hypothetical protein
MTGALAVVRTILAVGGGLVDVGVVEIASRLIHNKRNRFVLAMEISISPLALSARLIRNECGDRCVKGPKQ